LSEVFQEFFQETPPESILDIAGGAREVEKILKPKKYINIDKRKFHNYGKIFTSNAKPDIELDLSKIRKLPIRSNSFNLVVMSQILEHLDFQTQERIVKEAKRISKKYIIVGLPNELVYFNRLRILFGVSTMGIDEFGHHYMFNCKLADKFVKWRFKPDFKIVKKFNVLRGPLRHLPKSEVLLKINENLFTYEVYYLLQKKSTLR